MARGADGDRLLPTSDTRLIVGSSDARDRSSLPRDPRDTAPLEAAFAQTLDQDLARLGMQLTPGQRAAIDAHARLLLAWNRAINLTALRQPAQVAREHVIDSLSAVAVLHPRDGRSGVRLLDLGSGGGYPGLPLGVVIGAREVALVDSIRKKAAFLEVAAAAATRSLLEAGEPAPHMSAPAERAESIARRPEHRERWDVVSARAVSHLADLVELALPLLRVGGRFIAWKGVAGLEEELRAARAALVRSGSDPRAVELHAVPVPELADHRLVAIHKTGPTPLHYPRPVVERRRAAQR